MGKTNYKIANETRKKEYYINLQPPNVEDLNLFPEAKLHPIIFEEIYELEENLLNNATKINTISIQ